MPDSRLTWHLEERRGAIVVAPDGRVDETTATEFGDRLAEAVTQARAASGKRLVVDLSDIAYMSSRGLRMLTIARRQANDEGVSMLLAGANETMQEILAISRYDQIFQVFGRAEEAIPD